MHLILTLKTLWIFTKNVLQKPYSYLAVDDTLAWDNPLQIRNNLLERIWKIIMTIDDRIRDGKLQYDVKRETGEISAVLSGKIDKKN